MKAAFYTLGCKVNQYETEVLSQQFADKGFELGDFEDICDVYIINTCTVTSISDRKSRNIIRRAKKKNPDSIVAVTGCYSQIKPDEAAAIEGVDIVTGTSDRLNLLDLVMQALNNGKKIKKVNSASNYREFEPLYVKDFSSKTRAIVKIQDGCNNYCSYCIIPYARGPIRSKPFDSAIEEIESLLKKGFIEIVLTGIHLASYKDNNKSLLDLLCVIDKLPFDFRLRLGSLEPTLFTDEFVRRISKLKHLCPHFHISLQSGCDETLKRMNRKYTSKQYKDAVARIRCVIPNVAVTTDIMVGFPGETEEEFAKSLAFAEDIAFSHCHVFPYSIREGTKAASMKNQIPKQIKEERAKKMGDLAMRMQNNFLNGYIGKTVEVLFEQEIENGIYEGSTPNYINVRVQSNITLHNITLPVLIISASDGVCTGKVLYSGNNL